jgi:short-subunit dehydrogenase
MSRTVQPLLALVTGASGGIGRALACEFARRGCNLILTGRSAEGLADTENLVRTFGAVKRHTCIADLGTEDGLRGLIDHCREAKLEPDVLVNNAGFGDYGAFSAGSPDRYRSMLRLNTEALTLLTHHFLQGMLSRKRGWILNVASTAAVQPDPGFAVYGATKSYVLSFSQALHHELNGSGVSCTALLPGPTESGFIEKARLGPARVLAAGVMPAESVAQIGVDALFERRMWRVPGWRNAVMARLSLAMPSSRLKVAIAGWLLGRTGTG